MITNLARHWWALAIRGAASIVFGLVALFWPPAALLALVAVFGAYALVDGVFNLVHAIRAGREGESWGPLLFEGIVSIVAGVLTLFWPGVTALAFVLFVAAWSLVTGVAEIATAIRLRKVMEHEWMLLLSGVLSVVFGALLFISPMLGAIAIAVWIGVYAVLFGAMLVGLSLRLRSLASSTAPPAPQHAH